MALTRDFKETIRARVKRDPGFRNAVMFNGGFASSVRQRVPLIVLPLPVNFLMAPNTKSY
jgi:hypothetical protein